MNEKWKSSHAGAESDDEGSRTGAGELAGSEEPAGFAGSGEPDVAQKGRREAEDAGYIKKYIGRKKA